jgi:hypothetical protein
MRITYIRQTNCFEPALVVNQVITFSIRAGGGGAYRHCFQYHNKMKEASCKSHQLTPASVFMQGLA